MADTPMATERDEVQRHPQMADALQYLDWVKRAYITKPEARFTHIPASRPSIGVDRNVVPPVRGSGAGFLRLPSAPFS